MPLTDEQRRNIVRAAKEWLGTPYHHMARVKHAGADCAMFPLAVYQECGVLPNNFRPPHYAMQWHLHRSDEMYLKTIAPFAEEICLTSRAERGSPIILNTSKVEGGPLMLPENPRDDRDPSLGSGREIQPADFVVFKFGRAFSHGAIVVEWPIIIHSYIPHGVQLGDALRDGEMIGREMKFFEVRT